MKLIGLLITGYFLVTGCGKEGLSSFPPEIDTIPSGPILLQGQFSGKGGHTVSGSARVIELNGDKFLLLRDFSTTHGPDLKIYLSEDLEAGTFIRLGDLKYFEGDQQYQINGTPDLNQFQHVLVWCEQYGILFGAATLQ